MVFSDVDIKNAIKQKKIIFEPEICEEQIGPSSVDLTLDGIFWVFKKKYLGKAVDLQKIDFKQATEKIEAKKITLLPNQMCLGITKEKITLANDIIGFLEGRSRYARMGLAVHVTSSLIQPASSNHQVLEIVNFAPFAVTIHEGMRISQVVFETLKTPTKKPYAKFGKIAIKQ